MFLFFLSLFSLAAISQTSYLTGNADFKDVKTVLKYTVYAKVEIGKDSRTWYLLQCDQQKNCVSYKNVLSHGVDGKWYFETPGSDGYMRKSVARVDENHVRLYNFETQWTSHEGRRSGKMTHLTVNGSNIWKEREESKKHVMIYESKAVLTPISKEEYDKTYRGLVISPLRMNLERPKK